MRPAFLPWHRQFILDFENDMRKADAALTGKTSDLSLPYWNWINFRSRANFLFWGVLWSEDFMGWDGDGPPDNKVTACHEPLVPAVVPKWDSPAAGRM